MHCKFGDEIFYEPYFYNALQTDYIKKLGEYAFICSDKKLIEKQRAVLGYLIKSMGLNLIKGKSVMNVSFPVNIFDTRTLLELIANTTNQFSDLFEKAALCSDPLERIKFVVTMAVARTHLMARQYKPFNPIIGETFQCSNGNTKFYIEQTSHHPPIASFYSLGKGFKIYGTSSIEAATGLNSVKSFNNGKMHIEFEDKTILDITFPTFKLSGTMMGTRTLKFQDTVTVTDVKNDLFAEVLFGYEDNKSLFYKVFKTKEFYPDQFYGIITKLSSNSKKNKDSDILTIKNYESELLSSIQGEYSSYCMIDNKLYWQYDQENFPVFRRLFYTLPSDSTFREDLILFKNKDELNAQQAKIKLEDIQRNDTKLREINFKK